MSAVVYAFGPFQVDTAARRLRRAGEAVHISDRHFDVLLHLVSHPEAVISKDTLVQAGWGDVAVTDNSLEQAVSALRRALDGSYIETVARRGYRFNASVTRTVARESDDALDALLAPHRAWVDGRAALETLERDQIVHARTAFEQVLRSVPDQALAHVGLANACVMQFETTRADQAPDTAALAAAAHHAREACRLDSGSAEAWATLGFVLERTGNHLDALAACRRSVTLEPDNWRHHLRLASVSWGEERLRAARRTLSLLPHLALAHWLAATVHVARQALDEAERELIAGAAVQDSQVSHERFSAVGLHWLLGLVYLARDEDARALEEFHRELSFESNGHLYGRECAANAWYAIGALHLRQRRTIDAIAAFDRAISRVARHPLAHVGRDAARGRTGVSHERPPAGTRSLVDDALCRAAQMVLSGHRSEAARMVAGALDAAPSSNAGWLIPIEPLLQVSADPVPWMPALARLRARAV